PQPVGRQRDVVALELERHLEHLASLAVVVDDDDLLPPRHVLSDARNTATIYFCSVNGAVRSPSSSTSTLRSACSSLRAPARASLMPSSNAANDSSSESPPTSSRSTTFASRWTISSSHSIYTDVLSV